MAYGYMCAYDELQKNDSEPNNHDKYFLDFLDTHDWDDWSKNFESVFKELPTVKTIVVLLIPLVLQINLKRKPKVISLE